MHRIQQTLLCILLLIALPSGNGLGQEFSSDNSIFSLNAQAIQSSDVPLLLTITLKNISTKSITYWCGGPGGYPNAKYLSAQYVDPLGKMHQLPLNNWQYEMGSGRSREVKPGESVDLPAAAAPPPPGTYSFSVEKSKPIAIVVRQDEKLRESYEGTVLAGVRRQEPFFEQVAAHYRNDSIDQALLQDLLSDDLKFANTSAYALTLFHVDLPKNADQVCGQALTQNLASTVEDPHNVYGRRDLLRCLDMILAKCRTDQALASVIGLAHSHAIDQYAVDLGQQDNQLRAGVMFDLGQFPQPQAVEELHGFLDEKDLMVQFWAAQALANKKDPLALELLLTIAQNPKHPHCGDSFNSLLNYPGDPRVKPILEKAARYHDSYLKSRAKSALDNLHRQL